MALFLTRRKGESFSVRSADGRDFVQVAMIKTGAEPLLAVEAASHLRIVRDEGPSDDPPPIAGTVNAVRTHFGLAPLAPGVPETGLDAAA